MPKAKPWREFEILLANIHKSLAPGAEVKHDQRVVGRSGRRRQLDIVINQRIGLYPTRIVIECRKYRRPVSIEKVEAFAAKLGDVDASEGVIVSSSGFDAGAKAVVANRRITLLRYREATNLDWNAVTSSDAWVRIISSRREILSINLTLDDNEVLVISDGAEPDWSTAKDLAREVVDESPLGQRPGRYEIAFEPDEVFALPRGDEIVRVLRVNISCRVRSFEHLVNVSLAGGHVLTDPAGDVRYRELVSQSWDVHQLLGQPPLRELTSESFDEVAAIGRTIVSVDPRKLKRFVRVKFTEQPK